MKLVRYLANLGYGSRREVMRLFADGLITDMHGQPLDAADAVAHEAVRVDGEPLDPAPGVVLMLHKPVDVICSHADAGPLVHSLLPPRYRRRKPAISGVGRLDRDTSGLLLLTDDGALLHRIIAPRAHVAKIYEATLAEPLRGDEAEVFARGELMLRSETRPLAPARLDVLGERHVRLTVNEGRYHQVRRMFAAVGNRVETLHRSALGGLALGSLPQGHWRVLDADEIAGIFVKLA
ncbi:MAG TPA: 16S rRNA pseudouridine(516) synthase [Oleiagrimonas sp.]|nr:16S rRNA pseudouridine(516) synthase [Oleiagrimonas sp.]